MFPSLFIDSFEWQLFSTAALTIGAYGVSRHILRKTGRTVPKEFIPNQAIGWGLAIPFLIYYFFQGINSFPITLPVSQKLLVSYNFYEISTQYSKLLCCAIGAMLPWASPRLTNNERPS